MTEPCAIAYLRSTPTEPPDLWLLDGAPSGVRAAGSPRRLTAFNAEVLADLELREPQERHVDGRRPRHPGLVHPRLGRQAVRVPASSSRSTAARTRSTAGRCSWEFQVLAAAGIGVFYCNPRGSEGYGQAFNDANHRDWGPGPMRDVLAGVDSLVADGLADPDRLGVTGGSYGGYLTNWIVGHDQRFRAAMTCRCVSDMAMLFLTGDISGGDWAEIEFDATPWERSGLLPRDLADHLRRGDPDAVAHPALGARPPHDDRPGRGAVHGPALASGARSACSASRRRPTS